MASSRINCPQCGKQYAWNASLAGRSVKCAKCGERFLVPSGEVEEMPMVEPFGEMTPAAQASVGPKERSKPVLTPRRWLPKWAMVVIPATVVLLSSVAIGFAYYMRLRVIDEDRRDAEVLASKIEIADRELEKLEAEKQKGVTAFPETEILENQAVLQHCTWISGPIKPAIQRG